MKAWLEEQQQAGKIEIMCRTILPTGDILIEYRTTDPISEYSRELQGREESLP